MLACWTAWKKKKRGKGPRGPTGRRNTWKQKAGAFAYTIVKRRTRINSGFRLRTRAVDMRLATRALGQVRRRRRLLRLNFRLAPRLVAGRRSPPFTFSPHPDIMYVSRTWRRQSQIHPCLVHMRVPLNPPDATRFSSCCATATPHSRRPIFLHHASYCLIPGSPNRDNLVPASLTSRLEAQFLVEGPACIKVLAANHHMQAYHEWICLWQRVDHNILCAWFAPEVFLQDLQFVLAAAALEHFVAILTAHFAVHWIGFELAVEDIRRVNLRASPIVSTCHQIDRRCSALRVGSAPNARWPRQPSFFLSIFSFFLVGAWDAAHETG